MIVLVAVFALLLAARTVRIIPQARAGVVERLGRYQRTLLPGMAIVVPFVDRVGALIDLREQVVTFKPAGVITGDNVGIRIDGRGLRRGTPAAAVEAVCVCVQCDPGTAISDNQAGR